MTITENNMEILDKLVIGILEVYGNYTDRIVLYGSVARGMETPESDIDVAVFIRRKMDTETEDALSEKIVNLNLEYDRVLSVIDINIDEFEKWHDIMPFYKNIENEGIMLWKAA